MVERDGALSEEHVFVLSRRPLVLTMLAFAVPAVALMVAAFALRVPHAGGWGFQVCWMLGWFLLLAALFTLSIVVHRAPQSVCLDAQGVHLVWSDRAEHWPWSSVTCRVHGSHGRELVPEARGCGLSEALIARRERLRFWDTVSRLAGDPTGAREAAFLDAGQPIRYGAADRWTNVIVGAPLCAWALVYCERSFVHGLQALMHTPLSTAEKPITNVLGAALVAVLLVRTLLGLFRAAFDELRFLPDGVEERCLVWHRVLPYTNISHVTCCHRGPWGRWLRIHAGKRTITILGRLPYFWGAVRLLREHAPQAVWEERGG